MSDVNLVREERDILDSYERGEWGSVDDQAVEIDCLRSYAEATFKKNRRVNIRIPGKDLEAQQTIALQEGIPYQTLIGSILHKYVNGRLVDKQRFATGPVSYIISEEEGKETT